MPTFLPGQRWISETEPELGLGLVTHIETRRVQVEFPATGETRLYAADRAPLRRARFAPGDTVHGPGGLSFAVKSVSENSGLLTYAGPAGQRLPEADLVGTLRYDKPDQRLLAGHVDPLATFDLRLESLRHLHHQALSPARGFVGGRMELIPHQLYIAHEISRRALPRVLLADEVGLGKTIEACLILHRLLRSGQITRALIVVPDPLVHQWFIELLRRFALTFSIYDQSRCDAIEAGEAGANPFLEDQLVLCGIGLLAGQPEHAQQAAQAGWDLMIVDEAHHLAWSPEAASPEYQVVEALARVTPRLLLLTATPEQLGLESHFARLRLLDPHRYPDFDQYVKEHAGYEKAARKANAIVEQGDEKALGELLDRHGPGRVMFRNTRAAMPGFPRRILHRVGLAAAPEDGPDARVIWLADFLRQNADTKALVICQTRAEVRIIQEELQSLLTIKTAQFHEDMPLLQCDRQAAWFAEADGARVLIASEIGGEGRNFQFVQHLVLIGLPSDPEMLEQRIGRLDRIGQKGDIHIHVPFIQGSPEEGRLRWYHEGLNAFEEALSGSHEILLHFKPRLKKVDAALIKETKAYRADLKARIERGRDRLLELNSFRPAVAAEVVQLIARADADPVLEIFLARLFDYFGVHMEPLGGRDYLLLPGHMFDRAFPLREEQLRITYDRTQALHREEITFMSADHPMVAGALDLLLGSEKGNSAFAVAEGFRGLMMEAVFVLESVAPPGLELARFLPPTPLVVRLDHRGQRHERRPERLKDGPGWQLSGLPPDQVELVRSLLETARQRADEQVTALVERARHHMQDDLGRERDRLQRLRKVNDHIRLEEIEEMSRRIAHLDQLIGAASLRLDSVLLVAGSG
jgi:ATP-dependent helicase HepA